MASTKIEWTEKVWNPTTGCTKISLGCNNCYAEKMSIRLKAMGMKKYKEGFSVLIHEEELIRPSGWKSPKIIFVDSMSDLFHDDVPHLFIEKVFQVMNECTQHIFQILTKRPENIVRLSDRLKWTSNIWVGTSVESNKYIHRIDVLKTIPASLRFLSLEPLLSDLPDLKLDRIEWVIVGGESGPGARPLKEEWILKIRNNCKKSSVPFFFKQWGGFNKKANGNLLQGEKYMEFPDVSKYIKL